MAPNSGAGALNSRRAYLVWAVALSVYILVIFHRTSLGVAGILAAERFAISSTQLATFSVLQLAVFAAMQIPVGVLLDRFGPKRLLLCGLGLVTLAQGGFALVGTFELGILCRVLLGIGDSMIFSSVLRVVAAWFTSKRIPLITQSTGMFGQFGALAAATPLAVALGDFGWTPTFLVASSVGVVLAVPLLLVVRDTPRQHLSGQAVPLLRLARSLGELWRNPGTRAGMWTHFTTQFSTVAFALLWGYPFLVQGEGLARTSAGNLLILMTLGGMAAGPLIARFSVRRPYFRSTLALGIVAVTAVTWAVVLLWPQRAPLWLLVVLVLVMSVGGPGSLIGFDLVRSFHPPERLGRVTGIVNTGGFVAALITIALVGVILDWRAPGGIETANLNDFRVAMSAQFLIWGFGAIQLWRFRGRARRLLRETPGAMDAVRAGETLVPGLSTTAVEVEVAEEAWEQDTLRRGQASLVAKAVEVQRRDRSQLPGEQPRE